MFLGSLVVSLRHNHPWVAPRRAHLLARHRGPRPDWPYPSAAQMEERLKEWGQWIELHQGKCSLFPVTYCFGHLLHVFLSGGIANRGVWLTSVHQMVGRTWYCRVSYVANNCLGTWKYKTRRTRCGDWPLHFGDWKRKLHFGLDQMDQSKWKNSNWQLRSEELGLPGVRVWCAPLLRHWPHIACVWACSLDECAPSSAFVDGFL